MNFKILNQIWKVFWIFKVLECHIFEGTNVFWMWLTGFYPLNFFPIIFFYHINPFDGHLQNWFSMQFIFKCHKSTVQSSSVQCRMSPKIGETKRKVHDQTGRDVSADELPSRGEG